MLSDLALSIGVGSDIKWLYNSSLRLKRPLARTFDDTVWWRLTHHLCAGVGVSLSAASRAADRVLDPESGAARVRLRSTVDDTVAVSVDVGRFRDGAALAIAAAMHLATPRPRGRPPRRRSFELAASIEGGDGPALGEPDAALRLEASLAAVVTPEPSAAALAAPVQLAAALAEAGVPFVFVGPVAGVFHRFLLRAGSVDLAVDLDARYARSVARVLTAAGALPRGVPVRADFAYDAPLIRAAPCLALRVEGVTVNLLRSVPGVGEFTQIHDASDVVSLGGLSYRILGRQGYLASARTRRP